MLTWRTLYSLGITPDTVRLLDNIKFPFFIIYYILPFFVLVVPT